MIVISKLHEIDTDMDENMDKLGLNPMILEEYSKSIFRAEAQAVNDSYADGKSSSEKCWMLTQQGQRNGTLLYIISLPCCSRLRKLFISLISF